MKQEISIEDYYRIKISSIWRGFREEHISFWLACGYLILEYVRPQSIYTWLDVVPWGQIFVLGALGTWVFDQNRKWNSNTQNKLIITYFMIIVISCAFAFNPEAGYSKLMEFVSWLLIYFLIINIVTTRKRFFIFLLIFLLASLKMSQHGFVSWAMRGFSFTKWGVTGAPGWFHNSGEFGIQMTIFVPLAIAFISAYRAFWTKWTWIFFLAMPITGLGSIVATSSRGAQLAMAVIGSWYVLGTKYRLRAIVLISLVGTILWSVMPTEQISRITSSGEDTTSQQRMTYWKHGWEMMTEHPVLGVGYQSWPSYYAAYWPNDVPYQGVELPHNIFIQAGAELGFTGLFVYLLMILTCFALDIKIRRMAGPMQDSASVKLSLGLDGALIGYLVSGSFVSVLYYPYFWIHMALTVSFYTIVRHEYDAHRSDPARRKPEKRGMTRKLSTEPTKRLTQNTRKS